MEKGLIMLLHLVSQSTELDIVRGMEKRGKNMSSRKTDSLASQCLVDM